MVHAAVEEGGEQGLVSDAACLWVLYQHGVAMAVCVGLINHDLSFLMAKGMRSKEIN